MKGLFIPEITSEMFRNGCLESIETLMSEGEIYDIDYLQPCEECISRVEAVNYFEENLIEVFDKHEVADEIHYNLPSVTPKTDVLDKIRAEIDLYLFQNEFGAEYRKEVSQIIDKYKTERRINECQK